MQAISKGEELLDNIGFGDSSINKCLKGLGTIVVVSYIFTYVSLLKQKSSKNSLWSQGVNSEKANNPLISADASVEASVEATMSKVNVV